MSAFASWLFGLVGGFCAWFATEFATKPMRKFFDLRSEVRRQMIVFGNVRARWQENELGQSLPLGGDAKLSSEEEHRLLRAQETYRELGARIAAFADTELSLVNLAAETARIRCARSRREFDRSFERHLDVR